MLGRISTAALCCATTLCATAAFAEDAPLTFIATSKLAAQTAAPAAKWDFTLIDARTRVEYAEGHITGAQSCPASEAAQLLASLVPDKARKVVFYCNGPKCTKSQKAARAALALGYRDVLEYNEGLPAWREAKLPVEGSPLPAFDPPAISAEAIEQMRQTSQRPLLVDVRDRVEFDALHIPGSVNVQLDDLQERADRFPVGRSIVLVDHSGHQVPIAARVLNHAGHGGLLKKLEGGLLGWQQKKLPLVTGSTLANR
jgi:rhodanese-related sulfurtransferase